MATKPTHYTTHHAVGPFAKGQVVPAEAVEKWIGVDKDATDAEKAAEKAAGLKRLLDLGAITEAEAPPTPEEEAEKAAKAAEEQRKADEDAAKKAAAAKHPEKK